MGEYRAPVRRVVVAKITKRFVDALRAGDRETVYWDDDLPRFGVRSRPGGGMSYICQYRTPGGRAGRTRKLLLGRVGDLTPEQARSAARSALASVAGGKDPAAEKRAQRAIPTVAELVEKYLDEGPADKPDKKMSSWATDASNLRRHVVPLLGRRRASTLTKRDIQQLQANVTSGATKADRRSPKSRGRIRVRGGAGTAWRTTVVFAGMLAWAVERGILETNSAKGVRLNKPKNRERFLTDDEVAALGAAMVKAEQEGANPRALAIIRLLLLTGARRNEIEALRPEYVDFQRGAAFLPDSKTDSKTMALGAAALEVLASLSTVDGWYFPATRGDGHYQGVSKVWRSVREAAVLKGVRLHDLRHSFASVTVAGNNSLFLLGKILGHAKAQTTEKYAHLMLDPLRAVADQTSQRLAGALKGTKATSTIVALRRPK
jgi:integrase